MGTEKRFRPCRICRSVRTHSLLFSISGYPIWRCLQCGVAATEVGGSFDAASIYGLDYFQGGHRDGYADYKGTERVIRAEFRHLLRYLSRFEIQGKVLEIGSAFGFFLQEARAAGYESIGIEINREAVEFCRERGLSTHAGELDDQFTRRHGPFGAIVALDVIEHLPDPRRTLELAYACLQPNGHLILTTGALASWTSRFLGKRWRLLTPPQHLFFFSRNSLSQLLTQCGFVIQRMDRPWKRVPAQLMVYQAWRMLGLPQIAISAIRDIGVPMNLWDTVRIVARAKKRAPSGSD